jgi:polyphosphate kinase
VLAKRYDIFDSIRKQDILLHHPFQSFSPVIELLQQAPPTIRRWWRSR